jgi:hypothetical protein
MFFLLSFNHVREQRVKAFDASLYPADRFAFLDLCKIAKSFIEDRNSPHKPASCHERPYSSNSPGCGETGGGNLMFYW